jgi:uncharacterized RmlC-like cupin family protein
VALTLTRLRPATGPRLPIAVLRDIAAGLAGADLTPVLGRAAHERTSVRLLATDAYEAWLLHWRPGSAVTPHDHGDSHGAVHVVTGELTEVRWYAGRRTIRDVGAGGQFDVPHGLVHDVVAFHDQPAVSIHVYSPPLTSMGFYDHGGRNLVRVEPIEPEPPALAAAGPGRVLHPSGG